MNQQGVAAERAAETFLRGQGLIILARNWQCKAGEIDLICQDGKTLVFVEVRQRRNRQYASAAESITYAKQQKLIRTAQAYLLTCQSTPPCRFDAVLFDADNPVIWLKNIIES